MKKLKIWIVGILAVVALIFMAVTPIVSAGADELSQTTEISSIYAEERTESVEGVETPSESESVENTGDYMESYYYTESEEKIIRFDFLDESNIRCVLILNDEEVATVNATYNRIGGNIVEIYAMSEWMGTFRLNADKTATDISYQYEDDKIEDAGENTPVLDEEKQDGELTLDELSQIIADYLASKKTDDGGFDFWAVFQDAQTWMIATFGAIGGLVLSAVFAAILGHFKNKGVINTEKNVEQIAAKAATGAVKGIIGSSINLDISAEVNKAVEKFMYGIKNELDGTFDMAKNVEILTAEIAQAISKSRVLTKEEQEQLKSDASAVMAHAQKGGTAIKAPAAVVVSEKKEEEKRATATESVTEDNGYTLNFGGI